MFSTQDGKGEGGRRTHTLYFVAHAHDVVLPRNMPNAKYILLSLPVVQPFACREG